MNSKFNILFNKIISELNQNNNIDYQRLVKQKLFINDNLADYGSQQVSSIPFPTLNTTLSNGDNISIDIEGQLYADSSDEDGWVESFELPIYEDLNDKRNNDIIFIYDKTDKYENMKFTDLSIADRYKIFEVIDKYIKSGECSNKMCEQLKQDYMPIGTDNY